jgi:Spy/CpxP family protein refolding chaperone
MKSGRNKILALGLAIALVGAVALSQTVSKVRHHMHGGPGFGLEHMVGFMTDYLDLTDAQQAQVKQIIESGKPTLTPLIQQLHQTRQQLRQLETSGTFDEAKVRAVASQQAQLMTELTVQKAKIHAQVFNVLTSEQKTKANEFLQRREERFQKHMQNTQAAPPATQD